MISVCAVTVNSLGNFNELFIENIKTQTELVNEVIFVNNTAEDSDHYREWTEGSIVFKEFGPNLVLREHYHRSPNGICVDHAVGMHKAISKATNDYVFMSDIDVFFYNKLDRFYYDTMQKYDLNYVGLSHFSALQEAFTFFPNVFSAMVRKSDLPTEEFLKDKLVIKDVYFPQTWIDENSDFCFAGQYLMPGKIKGLSQEYPNPDGHYETGAPLYLWAKEENWKWLAFQTSDVHIYTSKFCRGNIKVPAMPKEQLLYHATNGSEKPEVLEKFLAALQKFKEQDE